MKQKMEVTRESINKTEANIKVIMICSPHPNRSNRSTNGRPKTNYSHTNSHYRSTCLYLNCGQRQNRYCAQNATWNSRNFVNVLQNVLAHVCFETRFWLHRVVVQEDATGKD